MVTCGEAFTSVIVRNAILTFRIDWQNNVVSANDCDPHPTT